MKYLINSFLQKFGFTVNRYPNVDVRRRKYFLNQYKINKIFDVGANTGQYAMHMRKLGFKGEIISFEPLSKAFIKMQENAKDDIKWKQNNYAIGDKNEKTIINISNNSYSSSISDILETHTKAAPDSFCIGTEKIEIKKLDSIFEKYYMQGDRLMLKIDTQGYEKKVIVGARNSLQKIVLIQLEMSLKPLYKDEMILSELISYLNKMNFELIGLENGFSHPETKHLLQVDGVFINRTFYNSL